MPGEVTQQLINVRDLLDDPSVVPTAAVAELEDMVSEQIIPHFKEYR